jgi:hypothetical protein
MDRAVAGALPVVGRVVAAAIAEIYNWAGQGSFCPVQITTTQRLHVERIEWADH